MYVCIKVNTFTFFAADRMCRAVLPSCCCAHTYIHSYTHIHTSIIYTSYTYKRVRTWFWKVGLAPNRMSSLMISIAVCCPDLLSQQVRTSHSKGESPVWSTEFGSAPQFSSRNTALISPETYVHTYIDSNIVHIHTYTERDSYTVCHILYILRSSTYVHTYN